MEILKRASFIFFIILYVVLFIYNGGKKLPEQPRFFPGTDATNYFMMAFNLKNHGIFSHLVLIDKNGETIAYTMDKYIKTMELDKENEHFVPKTSKREPGYPFLLSLAMYISPTLKNISEEDIVTPEGEKKKLPLRDWSYLELAVLFATSILTLAVVYRITKNRALSILALYGVGLSPALMVYCRLYLTENLAALFLLGFSFAFYSSIKSGKKGVFLIAGVLLGILTLTRAVFQYLWFPLTIFIVLYIYFKGVNWKRGLITVALFLASYFAVISPWMARNYINFDKAHISERGGIVLLVRSHYNTITLKEYFTSFLWWTPTRFTDGVSGNAKKIYTEGWISRFVDYEDVKRLDLGNPDGFRRETRRLKDELYNKYGSTEADIAAKSMAVENIKAHPVRHLLMCFPLAWRGMFVEVDNRFFIIPASVMSLLLFIGFFGFTIRSIRKGEWKNIAFILASMYIFTLYPLVTHNIPRYQRPLIPILWITTILFFEPIISRLTVRIRDRFRASPVKRSDN